MYMVRVLDMSFQDSGNIKPLEKSTWNPCSDRVNAERDARYTCDKVPRNVGRDMFEVIYVRKWNQLVCIDAPTDNSSACDTGYACDAGKEKADEHKVPLYPIYRHAHNIEYGTITRFGL